MVLLFRTLFPLLQKLYSGYCYGLGLSDVSRALRHILIGIQDEVDVSMSIVVGGSSQAMAKTCVESHYKAIK